MDEMAKSSSNHSAWVTITLSQYHNSYSRVTVNRCVHAKLFVCMCVYMSAVLCVYTCQLYYVCIHVSCTGIMCNTYSSYVLTIVAIRVCLLVVTKKDYHSFSKK